MRCHLPAVLIAAAFVLWLPACVNLKPKPSLTKSYTLGPVEAAAVEEVRLLTEPIYIFHPQVPTYLDNPRLSYRLASGEVIYMHSARWAEPLAEGLARAMSLLFTEFSPGQAVEHYPWPNSVPEASRISLNFQRFGATATGEVQVVVHWEFRRPDGNIVKGQFASEGLSWVVGDPDSLVQAYNQALRALTLELGEQVQAAD